MKKMTLVDMVQENIKQMIDSNQYDENGFLPCEGELADKFSVSRATVREAVRSMSARGYIKVIHGKGIMVSDDSVKVVTQSIGDMISKETKVLDDLLEMRIIVEPSGARMAAQRRTDEDLKILENLIEIMEQATAMEEEYYKADLNFHVELARISGNRILQSFITAYTSILRDLIIESSNDVVPIEQRFHFHRNIYEAIRKQAGEGAETAMRKHLQATSDNRAEKYNTY